MDSSIKPSAYPPRRVRALSDAFVEHIYRKAGVVFTYSGPPAECFHEEEPEKLAKSTSRAEPGTATSARLEVHPPDLGDDMMD